MERNNKSKGGRTPLPEREKRKHCVGTKLNDIELQILEAKIQEYKMSLYEYLRKALNECKISEKDYKTFLKVVDEFSISHVMRLCVIQSVVYPRVTVEEIKTYKDLSMQVRNYGVNIRPIAIKATLQSDEYAGYTDYVAIMERELEHIRDLVKTFQNKLKQ